jgi:(2Fe-2S) ferredoxin
MTSAKTEEASAEQPGAERIRLRLCVNYRANELVTSCGARGSHQLRDALEAGIAARGLAIELDTVHCMSKCHLGPTMRVLPDGPFVMGAQESDVPWLLDRLAEGDIAALAERFPLREDR